MERGHDSKISAVDESSGWTADAPGMPGRASGNRQSFPRPRRARAAGGEMKNLERLGLRAKLTALITLTSLCAIVLASVGFLIIDYLNYRADASAGPKKRMYSTTATSIRCRLSIAPIRCSSRYTWISASANCGPVGLDPPQIAELHQWITP